MPTLLLYGDTERSAAMRHEVPLMIPDPFLLMDLDGRRIVLTNALERDRIAAVAPDAELITGDEIGMDELVASGLPRGEIAYELVARAVQRAGVREALVPPELPVAVADRLRADGVELTVDADTFDARRRAKTPAELEGIRRAQRAADAGMRAGARLLASASVQGDRIVVDGQELHAEDVRDALRAACAEHGALLGPEAMVTSAWSGGGHEPGSGPLPANLPIEIDLWPRDETSGCFADMTRTFVVGDPTAEVAALRDVVREALDRARAATRPGVSGVELYDIAASVIEAAGHPTQRTREPGTTLTTGFYFSLGHGVGLEVHEAPALGRSGHATLVAGDVIAIEPGIEGLAVGGVRYEDLLLVTEDGCETLTDFPYDLDPAAVS